MFAMSSARGPIVQSVKKGDKREGKAQKSETGWEPTMNMGPTAILYCHVSVRVLCVCVWGALSLVGCVQMQALHLAIKPVLLTLCRWTCCYKRPLRSARHWQRSSGISDGSIGASAGLVSLMGAGSAPMEAPLGLRRTGVGAPIMGRDLGVTMGRLRV
jgi:hypothetical protein